MAAAIKRTVISLFGLLLVAGLGSTIGTRHSRAQEPPRPGVDQEKPAKEDYYDRRLPQDPREIRVSPYPGDRFDATVPDTLDLAENARLTINFLTRLISPAETDYSIYHFIHFGTNPVILEVGHGALLAQNAKWAEAIVLMRAVSGSSENLDQDAKLIGSLVRVTGRDGLCYQPVENRPWAFIDPVTQKTNKPFADMFCEGRQLLAYARWYQHDRNPLWKSLAQKKVDRLRTLALAQGDARYFRFTRGYAPSYNETGQGPVIALGDAGHVYEAMVGDAAAYVVCWNPQGLTVWDQAAGYKPARDLAGGLARYLYRDEKFSDRRARAVVFPTLTKGHPTVFTHCMNSLVSYALASEDQEMLQWCRLGVEQWLSLRDPDKTGIILSTEACQIADIIQAALMLSRSGAGNYWEDVDRLLRNSLAVLQVTADDVAGWKNRPVTRAGDAATTATLSSLAFHQPGLIPLNKPLPPWLHQPDDSTDRCLGAWFVTLEKPGVIGCCNGNMSRALYYAFDSILEPAPDGLKINLLLNRASPWADIDSYIPFEGKVVIRSKVTHSNVLIRIPAWTDAEQVKLSVDGEPRATTWPERYPGYISTGPVAAGVEIVVQFPLEGKFVDVDLPVSHVVSATQRKRCRLSVRGNTVVAIDADVMYPIHAQAKYGAGKVDFRRVQRFASAERFPWW